MAEKESEVEGLEHMFTNENAEPVHISYSVIESITKTFYRVIGHGGFGTVYLGSLRNDPMVAVKLLHPSQDLSDTQFMAEVKCLTRVKHKNIVRFLGYCAYTHEVVMKVEGIDRMVDIERKRFLCFEYAPNGNLQDYLEEKTHGYQWSIRYKIIKGICQGLHYLHQKRINHLDLKPANVLMGGAQMEPMITDFGISRHNDGTQSTIVTKNAKGTLGYMPPELITEGKISSKSDIFSLGVIMRRLLMGSDDENYTENAHDEEPLKAHDK
ncbi:hypothetical protein PR202_gb13546 [Eleusine coracana subsp. coracana]|uniref:Protein kinase domain-containing protein n=1 Tax=Eleusine coracana subsp. coracana TaxID=191504 RepID=A0AAV5ESP6_ELECO|nr:hypothetical protein PR202_gb13546 [Eleusine coracana subsp. coracana]